MTTKTSPAVRPPVDPIVVAIHAVIFTCFAGGFVASLSMGFAQRMLPLVVCSAGCLLYVATVLRWYLTPPKARSPDEEEDVLSTFDGASEASHAATLRYGGWMFAYLFGLWALGLTVSTLLFTTAFLRIERKAGLIPIVTVNAVTLGTAYALGRLLNLHWPSGFLPF